MRLESVLFKGSITVKTLRTSGDELILETDPHDSVPGTLYVSPRDIVGLTRLFMSRAFFGYMLKLPFTYRRSKKHQEQTGATTSDVWWET